MVQDYLKNPEVSISSAKSRLLKTQERYKRDFNKKCNTLPNKILKAGDLVFLDLRDSPEEKGMLPRPRALSLWSKITAAISILTWTGYQNPSRLTKSDLRPAGSVTRPPLIRIPMILWIRYTAIENKTFSFRLPELRPPHTPGVLKENSISSGQLESNQSVPKST